MLYLPLVVMGLLALGTYWLVRNTPVDTGPAPARVLSHEPDYLMQGFAMKTFDALGRMRTEVLGAKARHYPDTQWIDIDNIRIRSFDERGRLTTIAADRGLTNENSTEVQLMGNAIVVREAQAGGRSARVELRSEFLHAFMNTEQVKTDKPVEILRGNDRFKADSLDFDNLEQVLELRGRVKGHFESGQP